MALTKVGKEGITGIDNSSDATAITIDSGESVFIGNTAEFVDGTGTGDKGIQLNPLGLTVSTRNGGVSGIFGRQASDGEIIQVRKDGSSVGGIGSASGDLHIGTGDAGLRFYDAGPAIYPRDTSGNDEDGTVDLGLSSARFKDIYLSGGVRVGGTGTANALDDYEEGTATLAFSSSGSTFQYSYQIGFYTKVGRSVTLVAYMQLDGGGNSFSGNTVSITGLPFTSLDNAGHQATAACRIRYVNLGTGFSYLMATVGSNTTTIGFLQCGDNVAAGTIGANQLSSSSGQILFQLSYIAA